MRKNLLKTIAVIASITMGVNANAQMTLSKNIPTVGTKWDSYGKLCFNSNMPTPPSPSSGSNQTWDYQSVYNHSSMGAEYYNGQYEVIPFSSIAQQDLDSAANATYAVKLTSANTFVPDMLYFYEDIGDSLNMIAQKSGTNPTMPISSQLQRFFVFNTPINATMIAQVSELKYVGDGTLTTGNHTFNNLALLETVNSPTMTPHTRQFSFYQISPYFQLVAMFTFNDSTKNVLMNVYPPAGTIGAPAAPSNLTTTPVNSIRLDWQDNSNNEDGFIIETTQDTLSGSWTIVDTVATDVITYIHTGLTNGVTYYYRVKAYNANGNSAWSNISGATEGTAGISKMYNNELMFDIYPNPAKEMAIIENLASGSTLTITDIAGKVVYSTFINKEQVIINTSEFENGVYIVQIANNHAVYNKKLVVNN